MSNSAEFTMYRSMDEQVKRNIVYIYNPNQTDSANKCCDELCKVIRGKFKSAQIKHVDSAVSEWLIPLLVLCHNYSRIGTDIDAATADLHGIAMEHVAVLVVQMKDAHALPFTMPTENLVDAKYERFGKLVDFAFIEGKGLYPCNMNTVGTQKLESFLERYLERSTGIIRGRSECPWPRNKMIVAVVFIVAGILFVCGIIYWIAS